MQVRTYMHLGHVLQSLMGGATRGQVGGGGGELPPLPEMTHYNTNLMAVTGNKPIKNFTLRSISGTLSHLIPQVFKGKITAVIINLRKTM